MKVPRRFLGAVLALLSLSSSAPDAQAEDEVQEKDVGSVITLRLRTAAPKKSPWGELLTNATRRVKADFLAHPALKDAKLDLKIYWQIKSEASAVRQCADGKAGGIAVSIGSLSRSVPELDAIEIPFLFDGYKQADKAMRAAQPLLAELLGAKGFIFAVRGENGFRQWASKTSFLKTAGAFAGRAMRSQPSDVHKAMYLALGATPKSLQISEVRAGLANDDIDGYDNTLLFGRLASWSEAVQFVTISNHIYQAAALVWCRGWIDTVPDKYRDALLAVLSKRDALTESAEIKGRDLVRVFNDVLMPEQYKKHKKHMYALTALERADLKEKLEVVETGFLAQTSPEGKKLLDTLKANR